MASKKTRAQITARIRAALDACDKRATVAGFIVLDKAREHVATVRFMYPRDGAGRLQALIADWKAKRPAADNGEPDFETWTPWQYGAANGYGYDKHTAAVSGMTVAGYKLRDGGERWDSQLRNAGFDVLQAV